MDCSCGTTYSDGLKSGGAPCVTSCVQGTYGIPYCDCDCWIGDGPGPGGGCGCCAEFAEQSPDEGGESEDGVSPFGGLLAGDLTTPPFVPPKAERSWISSGNVSGSIV